MEALLGLSMLSFLLCLLMIIISFFRKNKKRKKWKLGLIGSVVLFLYAAINTPTDSAGTDRLVKEVSKPDPKITNDTQNASENAQKLTDEPMKAKEEPKDKKIDNEHVNGQSSSDQSKGMGNKSVELFQGFVPYQTDGFLIQIPKDWANVYSKLKYPLEKKFSNSIDDDYKPLEEEHTLTYDALNGSFTTSIRIFPYDKSEGYENVARKELLIWGDEEAKKINIVNVDAAYQKKNYLNTVTGLSVYKIIVFKNDICYLLSASHNVNELSAQGSHMQYFREKVKKFRSDADKILPSFQITDPNITIKTVLESETPPEVFQKLKSQ